MTDNKENRKSFEELIAETVERQYSMDAPKTITPQELEARLQKRKAQRRMCRLKTVGFAAIFVIAVLFTSIGFNTLTTNVGADKNDKEEIRTEDGVVIEDGGYGGSSEDKVVIDEWDDVKTYRAANPEIIKLNYIPEKYTFDKLTIEYIGGGDIICEYRFTCEKKKAVNLEIEEYIQSEGSMYFEVGDVTRILNCSRGEIYIQDEEIKLATMKMDDGIIVNIWSDLSDKEILKIIESINF